MKTLALELRINPDWNYGFADSNQPEKGGHPNRCLSDFQSLSECERLYVSQDLRMVRNFVSDLRQFSSGVRTGHVVTN